MLKLILRTITFSALSLGLIAAAGAQQGSSKVIQEMRLPSGVLIQITEKGTGPKPKASDTVQVHYEGTLPDGTVFDSSFKRGKPISFPLTQVIPCWTQGVAELAVGSSATLTCPAPMAYGARGIPGVIPSNTVLKFKVSLLAISS